MTDSYGCFSTRHVALADGLPYQQLSCTFKVTPNVWRKTLRRNICLERSLYCHLLKVLS